MKAKINFIKELFIFLFLAAVVNSCTLEEQVKSGEYEHGLKLAYNSSNGLITGIYEEYSGYDETTGNPRFSCVFYIHGFLNNNVASIETYYPLEKSDDLIAGEIELVNENEISIKLDDKHGGCWNVWDFTSDFTNFKLEANKDWLVIRFIVLEKTYFYKEKQEDTKRKAYLIEGDIVFIDKIENDWIHCSYYGKTITKGWMKLNSVNQN
jgi:hypothetical protein